MKLALSHALIGTLLASLPAQSDMERLRDQQQPTVAELRQALGAQSESLGKLAARIMVHEVSPLPVDLLRGIFADEVSRVRLLTALSSRPRRQVGEWLRSALPGLELPLAERLQVFAALPSAELSMAQAREILDGAASLDSWERSLAFAVADQMSVKQADLLVADVHKRCLAGVSLEQLLPGVSKMSARGERHLIGLARTLPEDQRIEIADWLSMRSSSVLQDFILDGLRGRYPLHPILLRHLDGPIQDQKDNQRILALLDDPSQPMQRAAFRVLCVLGEYHPALLQHALAVPEQSESWLRSLIAMRLPLDAMLTLLSHPEPEVALLCLRKISAKALHGALEARVFALAEAVGGTGDAAARVILSRGRPVTVERLWHLLSEDRRRQLHPALRSRSDWALELVGELTPGAWNWELRQTRIALGDEDELRDLLIDYSSWPTIWLRRMQATLTAALAAENLPAIETLLAASGVQDQDRRAYLSASLAARPDLGGEHVLWRLYREDADEVVRSEALSGLLLRPKEAALIFAELHAEIGIAAMSSFENLAYEVAGSMQAPLTASQARLLARLLLVGPLGGAPQQPADSASAEDGAMPANIAMVNIAGRILRSGAAEIVTAAFVEAAAEARGHDHLGSFDPRYLTSLLSALCFDAEVRVELGPLVAALILAGGSTGRQWLGPAWLIIAEGAAARQHWQQAADAYARAAPMLLRYPLPPLQRRSFLGEDFPGTRLGLAAVYAHRDLCQARASIEAGDLPAARLARASATINCYGDQQAEAELRALNLEFPR